MVEFLASVITASMCPAVLVMLVLRFVCVFLHLIIVIILVGWYRCTLDIVCRFEQSQNFLKLCHHFAFALSCSPMCDAQLYYYALRSCSRMGFLENTT